MGGADERANAALFLALEENSFVACTDLAVDRGMRTL
jgi:NAD(P)-dependent dehydrogenase (short-subunit alcohol dehydrogenase family)